MAQSFKTVGHLQPILARRDDERFVPVYAHYRLAAAPYLGWKTIAAIVEENPLSTDDVITRQLIAKRPASRFVLSGASEGHRAANRRHGLDGQSGRHKPPFFKCEGHRAS
jgi:hypothetical protein